MTNVMSGLKEMLDTLERKEFEKWYVTHAFHYERDPIGSRECDLQWAAWKARAALQRPCHGVAHSGCNYLAPCGSVCNKCGQAT